MQTTLSRKIRSVTTMILAGSIASQLALAGNVAIITGATLSLEPDTTSSIVTELQNRQIAVGNSVTAFDTLPADISAYSQVWDLRFSNESALSVSDISTYLSYLQSGKTLFLMGENDYFITRNNSIFSLVSQAGGGTLTLAPSGTDSQTLAANLGGGSINYSSAGYLASAGTGAFLTSNGGIGSAVVWNAGTLLNALTGSLTLVMDVNFMETTALPDQNAFLVDLAGYINMIAEGPAEVLVRDVGAIFSAETTGIWVPVAHREIVFQASRTATNDVNSRLFRLRSRVDSEGPAPVAEKKDGKSVVDAKGNYKASTELAPLGDRWSVYAGGNYGYADVDANQTLSGIGSDTYTATAGVEYALNPQLTLGLALTGLESNNALGSNTGKLDLNGENFTGYASWFKKNFYADALYSYGDYTSDIHRNTLLGRTATAQPSTTTHTVQLNTGYNLEVRGLTTGPIASLNYINGQTDAYTEAHGGTANTRVDGQNFDSLVSRLGWQITKPVDTRIGKLTTQVRASWAHEYRNESEAVNEALATSPYTLVTGGVATPVGGYSVSAKTAAPGKDYLEVGAGASLAIGRNASVTLDYTTNFFQSDSTNSYVSLTGGWKF